MVLRRVKEDLKRGTVDEELLNELGWSEEQLRAFSERMQQRLDDLEDQESAGQAEHLQRRRLEEMLKSLDLHSKSAERIGDSQRDREQQDTASRRSPPPMRYRDWLEMYQKSLSEGRR